MDYFSNMFKKKLKTAYRNNMTKCENRKADVFTTVNVLITIVTKSFNMRPMKNAIFLNFVKKFAFHNKAG
jgi:hypothetical protein